MQCLIQFPRYHNGNKKNCLFSLHAPLVQRLDSAIQRISIREINYSIRWIVIYPVDSAIQRLNNRGQTETRICYLSQWPIAQMSLLLFNTKSDFKRQIGRRVVCVLAFLTANLLCYPL